MGHYRTQVNPAGTWTDERVVRYDVKQDLYWVDRQYTPRVRKLVGALHRHKDIPGPVLTQQQVDWLHDNGYIIA